MGLKSAMRRVGAALVVLVSACATVPASDTASRIDAALQTEDLKGTRWGLLVETLDGREIVALRAHDRYQPASNTKLFTAAAAFHRLDPSLPVGAGLQTTLSLEPGAPGAPPDLVLTGIGDAMLGDGPDCLAHCLVELIGPLRAAGITSLGKIIADESLFPLERAAPGWSVEDLAFGYGTGVSSLVVNHNRLVLDVVPGALVGGAALLRWRRGDDLLSVQNEIVTVADGETNFGLERLEDGGAIRLYGVISMTGGPVRLRLGVSDPARMAGERLRRLLVAGGIRVEGGVDVRRRGLRLDDDPETWPDTLSRKAPHARVPEPLAGLSPPPLIETIGIVSRDSNNLHAELLLRHVGATEGAFSRASGLVAMQAMLEEAGVDPASIDLSDGSGMSTYNRVSPRALVDFLRWTQARPWGGTFRATLPVGGVDGTLARRFVATSLEGRIQAKTGTLTGVDTLAGFMTARSGEVLIFAAFANDRPAEAGSARPALDAVLVEIAASN